MFLNLEDKWVIVVLVNVVVFEVLFVVVVDYCGFFVVDMIIFCYKVCEIGVYLKVVWNMLVKCVVVGMDYECFIDVLVGFMVLVFF